MTAMTNNRQTEEQGTLQAGIAAALEQFSRMDDALQDAIAMRERARTESDMTMLALLQQHRGQIKHITWDTPLESSDDGQYGSGIGDIEMMLGSGITLTLGSSLTIAESLDDYMEHIEGHIEDDVPDERLVGFLLGIDETVVTRYLDRLQTYIEEHMYDREVLLSS